MIVLFFELLTPKNVFLCDYNLLSFLGTQNPGVRTHGKFFRQRKKNMQIFSVESLTPFVRQK